MYCLNQTRRIFIILVFIIVSFVVRSQVADDFSDGNFTINPEWYGDTTDFKITYSSAIPPEMKPALQLDGIESDTSVLYLPNEFISNTEWNIWIKLSFNTSANNFARIYLASDQENLEGNLNGYLLQVGGANDSITLYRQTGEEFISILTCETAFTGNSTNVFRLKIQRNLEGFWTLESDASGGYIFEPQGTVFDNTFTQTNYFGLLCKYTTSNATKFYFDDIFINEIEIDTIAPEIDSVWVISQYELALAFTEDVELSSSQNTLNYSVNNGIGNPSQAQRDLTDFKLVHLVFADPFESGEPYILTGSGVKDLSGNTMEVGNTSFIYSGYQVINPFDLLIHEVMADVSPAPLNLPEADYVEIYNRTADQINLESCTIQPGESADPIVFPNTVIEPDSFIIVVSPVHVEDFESYGRVVGLPGLSLNNEGTIILRNREGHLVHAVSYKKEMYNDVNKQEGGWSLEMIDRNHPCILHDNWTASLEDEGGTPGRANSVSGNFDFLPQIVGIIAISDTSVRIVFSQSMDSSSVINPMAYSIGQNIGHPTFVEAEMPFMDAAILILSASLDENRLYNLSLSDSIFNCSGDYIDLQTSESFVLPVEAYPYEIVINEIMADPEPAVGLPGYEYIEIFNPSGSYLNVIGWNLVIGTSEKSIPDFVMNPGEFIILTVDNAVSIFGIFCRAFGLSSLGLTNSGSTVFLKNSSGQIISTITYSDNWYLDDNKREGGWSLEQIDPFNPCAGQGNWGVSVAEYGGTPGSVNSIYAENSLEPVIERIIPVNDHIITVFFSQTMEKDAMLNVNDYEVDLNIGIPLGITAGDSLYKSVNLEFENQFQKGTIYTLSIVEDINNCVGLPIGKDRSFQFGIPEIPEFNDVVINEILFNPVGDGVDFVEIYNRSGKIIDLKELVLGSIEVNQFEPNDTTYKSVSNYNDLLLMDQYLVLTPNPIIVEDQYFLSNPDAFHAMNEFPSYNNESGTTVLTRVEGDVIDAFTYDENMHHPLLNFVEGVSLERINYNRPSNDKTNWHSASEQSGYATPGIKNSQFVEEGEIQEEVWVEPEIFSPDNDGTDDVANIYYNFGDQGSTAKITIYDSQGRLVKYLVENSLLGSSGVFSWDGRTEDNQKAGIGIYIIYFEAFNPEGGVKKFKKTMVVAGRL
ncbi:MAG: lamin tail domain-containing protein [Bacteroidales bacterium]|nr:lamin tail domain-containing protein [Bacteroidales bacterium]